MKLNNWCGGTVLNMCIHKLRMGPVSFGLLTCVTYWGVPLAFCAAHGTLISEAGRLRIVERLASVPRIQSFAAEVLPHPAPGGPGMSYLEDRNHLLFSSILFLGGAMLPLILRGISETSNELIQNGIINDSLDLRAQYQRQRQRANHWLGRFCSLCIAVLTLATFLGFSLDPSYVYWWGSLAHGYAGLALAIIEFIMVYFGTQAIIHIAFGAFFVGNIIRGDANPRIFHHDGCGGLSRVGVLVILLWFFAICLAMEILVTMRWGYLGIESQPHTWLLALGGILCLPLIALYPLVCSVRALQRTKTRELRQLEPSIMRLYGDAKRHLAGDQLSRVTESVDHAGKMISIHHHILEMNVWPFNKRALYLVFLIYGGQLLLTLRELFGH